MLPTGKQLVLCIILALYLLQIVAGDSSGLINRTWRKEQVEDNNQETWRGFSLRPRSIGELFVSGAKSTTRSGNSSESQEAQTTATTRHLFHVQVAAIHVDDSEFPLTKFLFKLTLKLALEAAQKKLDARKVKLSLSVRSASTCSRQFAGAVAAEEYYARRARLFIVSGCDDAIRGVSRLAGNWRVPVMTGAGFGADLNDKSVHKTLVRVAFSLRAAVEFVVKILKSFRWRRLNLIVDESDVNSLALKESIEKHSNEFKSNSSNNFQLDLNVLGLDLQSLTNSLIPQVANNSMARKLPVEAGNNNNNEDKWANNLTENAVREVLRQSSMFSRVNILLIPQHYLRKFMLSVHDQNMANGLYTFLNMPLIFQSNEDQTENNLAQNYSKQSYSTSTNENSFIWRSLLSTRNAQAKQAFESLMSIYLKIPTTKAYVYFVSRLSSLANTNYATTTTISTLSTKPSTSRAGFGQALVPAIAQQAKLQLSINPYSASFYDCLQIYATALDETLAAVEREPNREARRKLRKELHTKLGGQVRNRRFENLVTGTVAINENGDRETDYTLDDLNHLTGKFAPVILYKGDSKEIERLGRIRWSSDERIGPTLDSVDCQLAGTCQSAPISKFLVTLLLLTTPLGLVMGTILYFVYKRISLESQLVDYWWRINHKDIEFVSSRRKKAGNGSTVTASDDAGEAAGEDSQVTSSRAMRSMKFARADSGRSEIEAKGPISAIGGSLTAKTTITKATDTSAFASSAADVCYGNISLGIYKLAKVAVKPISKFHQSRKLMVELRTIKGISHANLCRFVGIVVDESNLALVNEFCPKGSLREFFQNESMVIDWTFKCSIINDITAGLFYLHSSQLEFHGRLKASNCLVSSRFVVKLSDYGLVSLREQLDSNETDEQFSMRKKICSAPEQLHASSSSNGLKNGSKKGDVYSFGLLLYEIMTSNQPFYNAEKGDFVLPLKTLLNELENSGPSERIGPDLKVIDTTSPENENKHNIKLLVDLMKICWAYDPNKRPSLLVVAGALKKITRGVSSKNLLENLTSRMEQYTNNLESLVDAKLATLVEEKFKTDELLYQFVPKSIAYLLKEGQTVEPEAFECVTVFYSDIVGFTSLSSESSPMEVIDFLSDLYLCFDECLEQYDIFKVDTIGDAYIVASGLPLRNEGNHVLEIARAALELREKLASFRIPHRPDRRLEMRVGIHSGPCIAGIVGGLSMPKYCIFGDTLSIGKFMESSGQPMKIHITEESKNLLGAIGNFKIEPRIPKVIKDGLPFQTYWLENEL